MVDHFDFGDSIQLDDTLKTEKEQFTASYNADFMPIFGNRAVNLKDETKQTEDNIYGFYQPPNCDQNRFWEPREQLFASYTWREAKDIERKFETLIIVQNGSRVETVGF